jgi:hypothetical protein
MAEGHRVGVGGWQDDPSPVRHSALQTRVNALMAHRPSPFRGGKIPIFEKSLA